MEITRERNQLLLGLGACIEPEILRRITRNCSEVLQNEAGSEQNNDQHTESACDIGKHELRSPRVELHEDHCTLWGGTKPVPPHNVVRT